MSIYTACRRMFHSCPVCTSAKKMNGLCISASLDFAQDERKLPCRINSMRSPYSPGKSSDFVIKRGFVIIHYVPDDIYLS